MNVIFPSSDMFSKRINYGYNFSSSHRWWGLQCNSKRMTLEKKFPKKSQFVCIISFLWVSIILLFVHICFKKQIFIYIILRLEYPFYFRKHAWNFPLCVNVILQLISLILLMSVNNSGDNCTLSLAVTMCCFALGRFVRRWERYLC